MGIGCAGMGRSLARHDEIVRTVIEAHGGVVFKHTGDGFGAVFVSVSEGLAAATVTRTARLMDAGTGGQIVVCSWSSPKSRRDPRRNSELRRPLAGLDRLNTKQLKTEWPLTH